MEDFPRACNPGPAQRQVAYLIHELDKSNSTIDTIFVLYLNLKRVAPRVSRCICTFVKENISNFSGSQIESMFQRRMRGCVVDLGQLKILSLDV